MKNIIYMRAVDALKLKDPPITKETYQKWVRESGLEVARNRKVPVEVEVP